MESYAAVGDYDMAERSHNIYVDLIEQAKRAKRKDTEYVYEVHEGSTTSSSKDEQDMDSDESIIQSLCEYCHILTSRKGDSIVSSKLASKLQQWVIDWEIKDKSLLSIVHQRIGLTKALASNDGNFPYRNTYQKS